MQRENDIARPWSIYKKAVTKVPLLKYSWIIVATICILAMIAYFKLQNGTVFIYAIAVIFISFIGFIFSLFLDKGDHYIRILKYVLVTCISITVGVAIVGFGIFIIWGKPNFYKQWFPDQHVSVADSSARKQTKDSSRVGTPTQQVFKNQSATKKKPNKEKILSIQLGQEAGGYDRVYVSGKQLQPLTESTTFNLRIDVSSFASLSPILIIERNGDSCFTSVPKVIDSTTYRIVPNCK